MAGSGGAPLMIAAKAGATECVQVLLAAGADVDARAKPSAEFVAEVQSLRARLNDMEDRLSPTKLHDEAGKGAIADQDGLDLPKRES